MMVPTSSVQGGHPWCIAVSDAKPSIPARTPVTEILELSVSKMAVDGSGRGGFKTPWRSKRHVRCLLPRKDTCCKLEARTKNQKCKTSALWNCTAFFFPCAAFLRSYVPDLIYCGPTPALYLPLFPLLYPFT